MKEKRTERKELLLTPGELKAFQAAADEMGLKLSQWIVLAAREKLHGGREAMARREAFVKVSDKIWNDLTERFD